MNKNKWIYGKEIIERWEAMEFEILEAFKNGLPAYKRKTGEILNYDRIKDSMTGWYHTVTDRDLPIATESDLTEILLDKNKIIFNKAEVEEYERKYGVNLKPKQIDVGPGLELTSNPKLKNKHKTESVTHKTETETDAQKKEASRFEGIFNGLSKAEMKKKQEQLAYHLKVHENKSWRQIGEMLFGDRIKRKEITLETAKTYAIRYAHKAGYKPDKLP